MGKSGSTHAAASGKFGPESVGRAFAGHLFDNVFQIITGILSRTVRASFDRRIVDSAHRCRALAITPIGGTVDRGSPRRNPDPPVDHATPEAMSVKD